MCGLSAPLVYECLDIHRTMLGAGPKGRAMRALERAMMRGAALLVVSSPAFLEAYFAPRQGVGRGLRLPTLLVENKLLELDAAPASASSSPPPGPPWRIAWMGAIRCRKSLAILSRLARRRPDLVDIEIHGRPAYSEFDDFDAQVCALPNLRFGGAYAAEDLPRLYGRAHFAWAIDYMEEGLNSAWLLPNRLYEASRFGVTPIALREIQTGRFLDRHGFGLLLADPEGLEGVLERLTPETYRKLRHDLETVPREAFVAGQADCRALVRAIAGASGQAFQDEWEMNKAELLRSP
jgi:hypothetical protein